MRFTYLLIDLFSVLFPLLFSFHPRLKFYKKWLALFPAMLITGLLFIAWDMYFTQLKIWGFNSAYLTGISVGNLPLEEVLFFLCIPYACVFTYACLPQKGFSKKTEQWVSSLLVGGSLLLVMFFHQYHYTAYTFALLAALIALVGFILKVRWLSRFYQTCLILLLPFIIVNGLLTGTALAAPVVWYNSAEMLGPRILTIPVEDIFYGMGLVLLNVLIFYRISDYLFMRAKAYRKTSLITGQKFTETHTNTYS